MACLFDKHLLLVNQNFKWTFFKSETPQTVRRNIRRFTFHTGHKCQVSNEKILSMIDLLTVVVLRCIGIISAI